MSVLSPHRSHVSPYSRYNLRRNPFGELTREERAELAVVDAEHWLSFVNSRQAALQFVGECGHGKTTHLLALGRLLPTSVYIYLPEIGPLPPIPAHRPLLLDEAQRLDRRRCREVFRVGGPLILGTHQDLGSVLAQAGLAVTTVDVAASQTPEQLMLLLNRRIESSRIRREAAVPRIGRQDALTLLRLFGADIRRIEQHLYDQFQRAVQKGVPWPAAN
jgi:hypothetical protein